MTIDQIACTDNCPKDDDHSDDPPATTPTTPTPAPGPTDGPCRGQLTKVATPKKIEFAFSADKTPQYTDVLATSFFVN